ncbi:class I SAM-dependent methyltransferase [Streptacidiphilus sp. N1-12]|uniref:Class I SAM-dependent methyltransferase n=2 Tax=Streptacidiphilus alkalitolerans TaxID=3342712 RepID=A0ABV6X553_9ACTN
MPTTAEQAGQTPSDVRRKADIAQGFDLVADTFGAGSSGSSSSGAGSGSGGGSFFENVGRRLVQLAGLRAGDRVLDLGCGRGAVLLAAAEAVGADGYAAGIDLSPEMVRATAAEIARRRLRNVAVRVDDAEDPGFPARSFEAVLAGLMMFITPDPAAALAAAHRVLVPGGRFAMTTFAPEDEAWQRPLLAALAAAGRPAGAGEWSRNQGGNGLLATPELIAELLQRAGFTEVSTVQEEQVSTYTEPQQWWTSLWSGGRRAALLEHIPEDRREDARKAAFAELDALTVDGVLTRRTPIHYTTAVKP